MYPPGFYHCASHCLRHRGAFAPHAWYWSGFRGSPQFGRVAQLPPLVPLSEGGCTSRWFAPTLSADSSSRVLALETSLYRAGIFKIRTS